MRPDISVLKDGQTLLVVEVKGRTGTSEEWAAEFRRNILEHHPGPTPPFFLLATPDRFYLWKRASRTRLVKPDFAVDPKKFLQPYYPEGKSAGHSISEFTLQLVVGNWLRELTYNGAHVNGDAQWLTNSGLLDSIHGGRVVLEPQS